MLRQCGVTRRRPTLHHGGCPDGFGAAWAAHTHFSSHNHGKTIHYIPANYRDPFPDIKPDSKVYILDFSYPYDQMIDAHIRHHGKVILLDHHKSTKENLENKCPGCYFQDDHSGAHMAWKWWFPKSPVPELVNYIEDRDLWKFELPNSREVCAALDSHPMDFATWNALNVQTLAEEGKAVLRYTHNQALKLAHQAVWTPVQGLMAPVVNTQILQSETCEQILNLKPKARFAAVYTDKPVPGHPSLIRRKWSLRSRPASDVDVAEIAATAGGGGHQNAAGFNETVTVLKSSTP